MNQYYYLDGYQSYHTSRNAHIVLTEFFFKLSPKRQAKLLKRIKQEQRKCKEQIAIENQQAIEFKAAALEWGKNVPVDEYSKAVPVAVVPLNNSGMTPPPINWDLWKKGEIVYGKTN